MLKEKALRTIKAEFKEYKQRILTNLSKEYIFEIAYQIYVKSRIYDFLIIWIYRCWRLAKYAGMDKRMFGERRELKWQIKKRN